MERVVGEDRLLNLFMTILLKTLLDPITWLSYIENCVFHSLKNVYGDVCSCLKQMFKFTQPHTLLIE